MKDLHYSAFNLERMRRERNIKRIENVLAIVIAVTVALIICMER